ncbi:uncharacterized protein LOC113795772 [Dermatophagoides pteronyssinus]|uniref:uncharacterized protein LOC113795772 n=1 Tax=Dermatophagoides pteronyssinus TaxID=6956 RepID=UPI003F66C713
MYIIKYSLNVWFSSSSSSSYWIWLTLISSFLINNLISAEPASAVERVNCRRVVFHPYCRGISAKRSSLKLKDASDRPNSIENSIKQSLPKIWQQLLIPNTRQKIIERFHMDNSIPRTMKAFIIDNNNNMADHMTNHSDDQMEQTDSNDYELIRRTESFQVPPYLFDAHQIQSSSSSNDERAIKSSSESTANNNDDDEINREKNQQMFHIRMVTYPEFMQFFSRLTPPSTISQHPSKL